ncbi:MAG: hypothetical protein H6636_00485 [Anaerolineales bacterium]|nr:hypothetical protein [Anaerolineales bacterium]
MDPVSTAIIAAITAGATAGLTDASKEVIVDAYKALKAKLIAKFGKKSGIVQAVKSLEQKPESEGRAKTLEEEVVSAKADKDPDILTTAQALLDLFQKQSDGGQYTQTAKGKYIAQAAGSGSTATVKVNKTGEK